MPFAAVFAYDVDAESAEAFEAVYGAEGDWARFFRSAEGFLGTELLRATEAGDHPWYLVVDRWRSAEAYERFRHDNEAEYARRGHEAEHLYRDETVVGRFETQR